MNQKRPVVTALPRCHWKRSARINLLLALGLASLSSLHSTEETKPNIIYILCDDLGYGDVKCLGGERSKIATPNFDKLASQGMVFTEAHSSSAVCTPTRYGILTGRYNWRSTLQKAVLGGYAQPLIDANRLTVATLLRQQGYNTACIGKWHLGMEISKSPSELSIKEGPTTRVLE